MRGPIDPLKPLRCWGAG